MIWQKTQAGKDELRARKLGLEPTLRSLLLLVDGTKSEELLVAHSYGVTQAHFWRLQELSLIEPLPEPVPQAAPLAQNPLSAAPAPAAAKATHNNRLFRERLSTLISARLGLKGFVLTIALEKAATWEELLGVERRVIEQIREREGDAVASMAKTSLYLG